MPATNLFTTAKTIEAKPTVAKKAKATTTLEGLEVYAAIDHSIKWLKTALETAKVTVQDHAFIKMIADGVRLGKKPENFDAVEGNGTGNIQLRKRSAASGLTEIEQELVREYGVPVEVVADRPETFIFNPEQQDWLTKNGAKVSAALAKLGAPEGIIQFQEATKKVVTTDDSLDFVFRTYAKRPEVIAELLPVVSTFAIKAKYDGGDENALEAIQSIMDAE